MTIATRLLMSARGGGGFTVPAVTVSTVSAAPEGGHVWFGGPQAVRNGTSTISGYITGTAGGDVKAILINNATRAVTSTTTLYDNFIVDDHSAPSFVVRPDGVIMAAFAYHLGPLYVGIGTSAGVLPAQAQVTNITSQVGALTGVAGYTYASIVYLDSESRYYIFFRYHDTAGVPWMGYTYSTDSGATWSARTLVRQITYHHVVKNGTTRLDFVLSDHPDHGQADNAAVKTSIFHMYYDGTWRASDGTSLGSLPIANAAETKVYDGATSRAWLWDIALNAGSPVVAYVIYDEPYATGTWHYQYGRWTGSAWVTSEVATAGTTIVTAGAENYAGGIAIDRADPTIVYYSSNTSGSFQVYRAKTGDGGTSWSVTALTADAAKNVRPVAVQGPDSQLRVLWLIGTYTDYFTYSQGIKGAG